MRKVHSPIYQFYADTLKLPDELTADKQLNDRVNYIGFKRSILNHDTMITVVS